MKPARRRLRDLKMLQPVKRRVMKLQTVYWKYLRPLYCEVIPTPKAGRVLVIAPHIDDDVIGCGGVLRQHALAGAAITCVYLRDGGDAREREGREAAELMGIGHLEFLRWPKGGVVVNEATVAKLGETVSRVQPDVTYAPFFLDPHPDHAMATSLLGAVINKGISVGDCYLYEVWTPLIPNVLVDITAQADIKRQAINTHRSQVETIDMAPGVLGLNAFRAEMNRVHGYAEAFLRLRPKELFMMLRDQG